MNRPVGPVQSGSGTSLKRHIAAVLLKFQGLGLYRRLSRKFRLHYEIVEATSDDWAQVVRLLGSNEDLTSICAQPSVTNFVAKQRGRIIGYVQLVRRDDDGSLPTQFWLFSLGVRLIFRGKGIGMALTQRVIEKARQDGADDLALLVFPDNQAAVKLYQGLGFQNIQAPGLESQLEKERERFGRRRIVLSKSLRGA